MIILQYIKTLCTNVQISIGDDKKKQNQYTDLYAKYYQYRELQD